MNHGAVDGGIDPPFECVRCISIMEPEQCSQNDDDKTCHGIGHEQRSSLVLRELRQASFCACEVSRDEEEDGNVECEDHAVD